MDIFDRFSAIFDQEENFFEVLCSFLYTSPLLKTYIFMEV